MSASADKAGIIYVAARSLKYLIDASLSALSCRKIGYTGPIALFTDIDLTHPYPDYLFTKVHKLTEKHSFRNNWASGKFHKLHALINSPYEQTLYLDVDTRVLSPDIASFPTALTTASIAMRIVGTKESFCARTLGQPLYNAGVIAFQRTEPVLQLFKEWQALTHEHHLMLGNDTAINLPPEIMQQVQPDTIQKLLRMDQLGLYMLMNPEKNYKGINVHELPAAWNKRGRDIPHDKKVIIHHTSRYRRYFEQDLKAAQEIAKSINDAVLEKWFSTLLQLWLDA